MRTSFGNGSRIKEETGAVLTKPYAMCRGKRDKGRRDDDVNDAKNGEPTDTAASTGGGTGVFVDCEDHLGLGTRVLSTVSRPIATGNQLLRSDPMK